MAAAGLGVTSEQAPQNARMLDSTAAFESMLRGDHANQKSPITLRARIE